MSVIAPALLSARSPLNSFPTTANGLRGFAGKRLLGGAKPALLLRCLLAIAGVVCLGASQMRGQLVLKVNTLADSTDRPDNCGENGGTGTVCSLRDAINVTNRFGIGADITFSVTGTITLTSALPSITGGASILGPGATLLTISGANTYPVFTSNSALALTGLTIANGYASELGGGVSNNGGLQVDKCVFYGNSTGPDTGGAGGGAIYIYPYTNYFVLITNSTFVNNSSGDVGGAILGYAQIENSTFSGNSAAHAGGALYNLSGTYLYDNTFSGNSSEYGGAVYNGDNGLGISTVQGYNNLVSGNMATTAGAGFYNFDSNTKTEIQYTVYYDNLTNGIEDDCNSCTSNANAVFAGSNPLAMPLGYYGGPTETLMPQPGSAAICAASAADAFLSSDQRGYPLTTSYSQCPSGTVDAGAVQTNYLQVQSGGDAGTGSGDCSPLSANCTLRDAIMLAGTSPIDIGFSSSLSKVSLNAAIGTLTLSGSNVVNIAGPGANLLTVNGNGSGSHSLSVFTVDSGVSANLYGLTISGGYSGDAGGINNQGTLAVLSDAVSSNTGGNGGGIENTGTLTVEDSTISGNSAPTSGGGIYSGTGSTTEIIESTLYGNTSGATGDGGGIYNDGTLSITGSTVWENTQYDSSGYGGGIYNVGTLTLANSVLAGNTTLGVDANFYGSYTDGGGNVVGGNAPSSNFDVNGNTAGPRITMSGLQYNGLNAALQTVIPLPGSPAICAGETAEIPTGTTTDERGYPLEPTDGYCGSGTLDAGAVQSNYTSLAFVQQPSDVELTKTMIPAPTLQVVETDTLLTSNNTDAVNVTGLTLSPSNFSLNDFDGQLQNTFTEAVSSVIALDGLAFNFPPATGDTLTAGLTVTGSTTISGTSNAFDLTLIPTTTTTSNVSVTFSESSQIVPVTATVTSTAGTVYEGAVSFNMGDGGAPVTANVGLNGVASANATLGAGDTPGTYTITANYSDSGGIFASSSDTSHTVTISPASTTTTASSASAYAIGLAQNVPLSATVTSAGGTISEGSVTFTVLNGSTPVGTATTGTVSGGTARVSYALPGSLTIGSYTIQASYSGSANFQASIDNTHSLNVSTVPSFAVNVTTDDAASPSTAGCTSSPEGTCTLRDAVTAADAAGAGTITFDPTAFATLQTISPQGMIYSDAADSTNPTAYIWITGPSSGVTLDGTVVGSGNPLLSFGKGRVVSLSGLTLTNGPSAALKVVENANVTVSTCTITSNHLGIDAEDPGFDGLVPTVTVSNSTFSNNTNTNQGGAIYATDASVTVSNSSFSGNQANLGGAAYVSDGSLTLQNSTVSSNTAAQYGGALYITQSGGTSTLTVNGSTINGNQVSTGGFGGGGIWLDAGTATITDSTISNNEANGGGGGGLFVNTGTANIKYTTIAGNTSAANGAAINSGGTVTLTNVTVYGNQAGTFAGGLDNENSSTAFTLANTIVAENSATGSDPNGINGFTSAGHNLIGDATGMSGLANGVNGDQVGGLGSPINPYLAVLGNYGGPTQTMTPLPGSPAIGAGDPTLIGTITADQRGEPATVGGLVDIGAVESQRFTLAAISGTPQSAKVNKSFSSPLVVQVTANNAFEPVAGGVVTFSAPGSGASATLGGSPETIGTNGQASDSATANATGGSYAVTASASGAPTSASFSLINAGSGAALISPAPNSVLTAPRVAFIWTAAAGATAYKLWIGTSAGKNDLYTSGSITATNATPTLATNGQTLYVTLVTYYGSIQEEAHYIYTAATPAALTSPAASSVLAGPEVVFQWSAAPGAAAYKLWIGSSAGKNDLSTSGPDKATSATAVGLPVNGETIYATLVTIYDSYLAYAHYTFTAATQAALTSPTPSTTLAGPEVPFVWSTAPNATGYKLWVGTAASEQNLYSSGAITTTSATPVNLPTNGETLYVTLVTLYGSNQTYAHYTFTAATQAALSSPTPSTKLAGASVPFSWSAATGAVAYKLWIGSSAGKSDLYSSGLITLTNATPTRLPTNGETVYVTLVTVYGTREEYAHYTFTAAGP